MGTPKTTMMKLTPILVLCVCALAFAANTEMDNDDLDVHQPMHSADQLSRLLRIKDAVASLSGPSGAGERQQTEVQTLGDSAPDEAMVHAKPTGVDGDLVALDKLLDKFERVGQQAEEQDLGETKATFKLTDRKKLQALINVKSDQDSGKAVRRVVGFLKQQLKTKHTLSRQELDMVRQFYIDNTANVLARFGYEDSPYGKADVSLRRGDAVAARQHMDEVDTRLHMAAQKSDAADVTPEVGRVVHYLKQTARLSDFLMKLSDINAKKSEVPHSLAKKDQRMNNLAKLQADEEKITDGIEELLHKIKGGHAVSKDSAAQKHKDNSGKGLEKRAAAESKRLAQLQAELLRAPTPSAKKKVAKQISDAKADKARHALQQNGPKSVQVPIPKLQEQLNAHVTDGLDSTLHRIHKMQKRGNHISKTAKAKINHLLHMITAHLLKTYMTYDEWTDKSAMLKESSAIKAGDAEAPSHIQVGHAMGSKHIVEQFIADTWRHPHMQQLPKVLNTFSAAEVMKQGLTLPNGAHITIQQLH